MCFELFNIVFWKGKHNIICISFFLSFYLMHYRYPRKMSLFWLFPSVNFPRHNIAYLVSHTLKLSHQPVVLWQLIHASDMETVFWLLTLWFSPSGFPYHCLKVSTIHISLTMLSPSSLYVDSNIPSFIILGHTKRKAYQAHIIIVMYEIHSTLWKIMSMYPST